MERYGRFEILGRIGRGGMAEILLARERALAGSTRHLVIKRVLPEVKDSDEMLHMFLDEARVVMGLSHPNLCQIYEIGEQEGTWFIAMEWVNGATLHHVIRRAVSDCDIDHAVVARVIAHAAEALHHAHTARDAEGRPLHLVHRDVSPHNIMLGYDGRVKLLDFGIAKSTKSTHQTEAGVVKGKVCYMAPEQWLSSPVDARTDVFALGACLYEALTGRVVFRRETQSEVMRAVLRDGAPALSEVAPEVPAALALITHKALAFSPEDRFQSALEMSEALEQYLALRSMPLAASRVAGYVRRLFRSEVELGPVLERQVRGAHLASAPIVLPPLPPALLGLPRLTPSLLGIDGADLYQPPDLLDLHSLPPPLSAPRSAVPTAIDVLRVTSDDAPPLELPGAPRLEPEDLTQSAERTLDVETVVAAPVAEDHAAEPLTDAEPEDASPSLHVVDGGAEPRQLARTVSMHAASRVRRVALLVVPGALAMAAVMLSLLPPPPAKVSSLSMRGLPALSEPAPLPAASAALSASSVAPEAEKPEQTLAEPHHTRERDAKPGKLSINTRPWSTVYLGNRVLGTTPLAGVSVPRTALTLKLVDRDGNVHLRRVQRSRSGERTAFYDFSPLARPRARADAQPSKRRPPKPIK
jgi:serine/threonine-protein kinase